MSEPDRKVLIVDDEPDLRDLLSYNLQQEGYVVVEAADGHEALERAEAEQPDAIVLDVMMPGLSGLDVARKLRQSAALRTTPILMLTALDGTDDHVRGLDVGADAYLTKDVDMPVFISQVKALMRGAARQEDTPDRLFVHDLEINRERYLVFRSREGEERESFKMPRKEFELLYFLASNPGKVFSRQDVLNRVWGRDVYVVDRTVDVHVRKVREKLGDGYIETVKGVGYRFRK
jgi:two-component system alkaline phosphatase synthesis response regulator PhoP